MPPRKSERLGKPIPSDYKPKTSIEYFEFHDEDLKEKTQTQNIDETFCPVSNQITVKKTSIYNIISHKTRLSMRKVHLICEIASAKFFVENYLRNHELTAVTLSLLPPHILRIFDPIMISEGKTLKNSLAMLATWWKNNIGLRMLPCKRSHSNFLSCLSRKYNIIGLKAAIFKKSAYEDDSVKLFAIICCGLGIKVRLIHSLDMILATGTHNVTENNTKFQYVPCHWIEIYSNLDKRWVSIDCIQGAVDELNRLENKLKPHCFVISVDMDGFIHDLTKKYAFKFEERSYKLRKNEDKWLKSFIESINSHKHSFLKFLPDVDNNPDESLNRLSKFDIPKTLSAIKNHPNLMLASQLKKYEVFYPCPISVGVFKDESVFLKENVKKVRSRDAWLSQCARVIKDGEEPIKLVKLPKKAGAEHESTGVQSLFCEWQTEPYVPPKIIDGKVPRNDHGNIDLFQPSMLPEDCVYVTLPGAWKVARHLKIDYADACIGFSFHGGRALPAIHGIVITQINHQIFQAEYKNKLAESFKNDAKNLEKQIAQKWLKIIKNALIAKRLKTDSSVSLSESLISSETVKYLNESEKVVESEITLSTFISDCKHDDKESEIKEFDAI